MSTLEAPEVDHYTPLARAVAAIDRDDYAGRFAVYDRAHKALLRRLATAAPPPSGAELEREEQAFREAVRRVEFADELAHEEAGSPALFHRASRTPRSRCRSCGATRPGRRCVRGTTPPRRPMRTASILRAKSLRAKSLRAKSLRAKS